MNAREELLSKLAPKLRPKEVYTRWEDVKELEALGYKLTGELQCEEDGETWTVPVMRSP